MQPTNQEPPLCYACQKNTATESYTYAGGHRQLLCERCLRQRTAIDELDHAFKQSHELAEQGQFDAALACLDAFMNANREYDDDHRFAHHVARHRVDILLDAGRYAEAERACETWAKLGFSRIYERWWHATAIAETLDALGRSREGLAILEEALRYQDPRFAVAMWSYLEPLAELSEKLGQPVDPKWRNLAEETATANGVNMPENASLGKAILELVEIIRKLPFEQEMHQREETGGDNERKP